MQKCRCEWERYPPWASEVLAHFRQSGPSDSGVNRYFSKSAADLAIIPMIESREDVENAEALMFVKGISGIFVGPVDLRLSMGLIGADGEEKEWTQALEKIAGLGRMLHILVGILRSPLKLC